jgi:hypothetical protein
MRRGTSSRPPGGAAQSLSANSLVLKQSCLLAPELLCSWVLTPNTVQNATESLALLR